MGFVCAIGDFSTDFFSLLRGISVISGSGIEIVDCAECVIIVAGQADGVCIRRALGVIVAEDCGLSVPCGVQLISCGLSHKNAVSVTSRTDERIILSLNRSLRTEYGIAEPLEMPASASVCEYELMAAFAARLMLS